MKVTPMTEQEREEALNQKVKRFDRELICIVLNVLVSLIVTLLVLHGVGVI